MNSGTSTAQPLNAKFPVLLKADLYGPLSVSFADIVQIGQSLLGQAVDRIKVTNTFGDQSRTYIVLENGDIREDGESGGWFNPKVVHDLSEHHIITVEAMVKVMATKTTAFGWVVNVIGGEG